MSLDGSAAFYHSCGNYLFIHLSIQLIILAFSHDSVCGAFLSGQRGLLFPGPRFNIKMSSYQYRKSHYGDKTVVRSSYLRNCISYTGKMTSLYWIRAQVAIFPIKGPPRCAQPCLQLYKSALTLPSWITATRRHWNVRIYEIKKCKSGQCQYYWPFYGESTCPITSGQWCGALMFPFVVSLNQRLNEYSSCRWFENPRFLCYVTIMEDGIFCDSPKAERYIWFSSYWLETRKA